MNPHADKLREIAKVFEWDVSMWQKTTLRPTKEWFEESSVNLRLAAIHIEVLTEEIEKLRLEIREIHT